MHIQRVWMNIQKFSKQVLGIGNYVSWYFSSMTHLFRWLLSRSLNEFFPSIYIYDRNQLSSTIFIHMCHPFLNNFNPYLSSIFRTTSIHNFHPYLSFIFGTTSIHCFHPLPVLSSILFIVFLTHCHLIFKLLSSIPFIHFYPMSSISPLTSGFFFIHIFI